MQARTRKGRADGWRRLQKALIRSIVYHGIERGAARSTFMMKRASVSLVPIAALASLRGQDIRISISGGALPVLAVPGFHELTVSEFDDAEPNPVWGK